MAITLQERQSSKSSNAHTKGYSRTQRNATNDDRGVQYRQLVSRAVTQRLHSPSLDDLTKTDVANKLAHPLKTWETQERSIARDKARIEAKMLDIPWKSATLEVHVLTPTRYEAPCGDRIKNQEASTGNEGVLYKFGALKDMDEDKE
ncbi:hypothetical protein IG631_07501 [Alternaria alternata]|nr:hypothetical protein IG631_07501 [Alternaria alternata]